MKVSGIQITDTELIFTAFPSKEIGLALYCKSFKVYLKDIKFIAISPRAAFDDAVIFIIIIDKNNKIHKIPYAHSYQTFDLFEKFFDLNPIYEEEKKFKDHEFEGKIDKIIYPKELYWQDLFENDWKLTVRNFYTMIYPKSCFG